MPRKKQFVYPPEQVSLTEGQLQAIMDLAELLIQPRSAIARMLIQEALDARLSAQQEQEALQAQQAAFLGSTRM